MKLSELVVGQQAKIIGYEGISVGHRKKLLAMGLLPQTRIHFVRVAPFGDPLQIKTSNISLALRKTLAEKITVEVI
ncbi:ferrous iron transport protein A [Motilimonas cestriensis]|uniref:Ferrous iron transport protein A n=1 Tax=Motilimonas cestriensis TaxID=2742685 RepID=A0ABS8W3H7_9GAMM|nr:FeoA family protein [Motilimonas cestriensis]MCE2593484.1 ferrous iron transport protein A [Motilimonas cestriensis]